MHNTIINLAGDDYMTLVWLKLRKLVMVGYCVEKVDFIPFTQIFEIIFCDYRWRFLKILFKERIISSNYKQKMLKMVKYAYENKDINTLSLE